ncbi:DEAD/DEAH box helicase [Magnetovibrio blakemorei]|uniref:DEAD/DEAH box helicase n=1 Tax=Magnetovibrio blakemorei TaxID=28181 RepID=UPI0009FCE9B8|nr:DEAD/DEAH box helicase [Magnetovibrio blakemorei]
MSFADTGLSEDVLRAVTDSGYDTPTPIQAKAIPLILMGRDILGCAQTGTGKTASFTLPMIDILAHGRAKMRMPRSLILEPTRELATQVAENFDKYGKYLKLNKALLIGGTDMKAQTKVLDGGADVLIATPGRLLDMFERGHLLMRDVKILVIDEADRMLDMGFIPDIEKIVSMLPPIRQTLFFSATMAPEIKKLADKFLLNPKEISVSAPASTAETVTQGLAVIQPGAQNKGLDGKKKLKREVLRELIDHESVSDAIVFCNRKIDVAAVYKSLSKRGYSVGQLHGDMSQPARTETLAGFKNKDFSILVCSDVAARGLDVPNLSHVFNFDVPNNAEDYVHRIGRTGRAGKEGHAYTIALPEDGKYVAAIEKLIGKAIPRLETKDFVTGELSDDDGRSGGRGGRGGAERSGGRSNERGGRGERGGRNRQSAAKPSEPAPAVDTPDPVQNNAVEATPVEAPAAPVIETAPAVEVAPAPQKTEAPARSEQPARSERSERPARQDRNGGSRDRGSRDKSARNDRSGRQRGGELPDIHNEICDGHMPAFLLRDPLVAPEKAPEKAPAKAKTAPSKTTDKDKPTDAKKAAPKRRAPRRKPAVKAEDAPVKAPSEATTED